MSWWWAAKPTATGVSRARGWRAALASTTGDSVWGKGGNGGKPWKVSLCSWAARPEPSGERRPPAGDAIVDQVGRTRLRIDETPAHHPVIRIGHDLVRVW